MRLGSLGIVARRGDVLEDLAAVDTVVFDKTGTLTAALPVLPELRPRSGSRWAGEDLRAMAAALETVVRHPIGDVFGMSGPSVTSVAAVRSLPGIGVSGTVRRDGVWHTVAVGRADAITSTCCQRKVIAALRDAPPLWTEEHELAVLIDGKVEGLAWAGEVPRPGLDALPSRLTAMGIACEVLSGDKQSRVERLRLADATGDLAPEQKLSRLEDLTAAGRIPMYVGDGLNDLGAMSAAIVTVGVDGGAPGVVGATDLLWDGRDLGAIPEAISFARAALASLRGTLRFAIAYNLIGMALASAGIVHPVVAALLMTGSSLFVTWRAGRLLSSRQPQAAPEKRIIPKPLARPSTPLPSMSVGLLPAEQGARSELL
jgi:cation transport ATPase